MSKTKRSTSTAATTIIYKGKKIQLSKCLKKDPRSYSKGHIYLKACDKKYVYSSN